MRMVQKCGLANIGIGFTSDILPFVESTCKNGDLNNQKASHQISLMRLETLLLKLLQALQPCKQGFDHREKNPKSKEV